MRLQFWILFAFGFLAVAQAWPQHVSDHGSEDDDYQEEQANEDDGDEEEESGPAPILLSRDASFTVDVGKTIVLPCKVENPNSGVIMWWLDEHVLWTGSIPTELVQTHSNFKLMEDHSLSITNVQPSDSNIYKCTVVHTEKQEVKYKLHVSVPPVIQRIIPSGPKKILEKGTPLTLMCEASGVPTPTITWTKTKHGNEERISDAKITIDTVNRKHSGVYECRATNSHGESAPQSVEIVVQYEPEVETEKSEVNAGEGYESELVCIVHGEPKVKVHWLKDDQPINYDHHITAHHDGKKHVLRISGTTKSDFGVYRCFGNNSKGSNSKTISLTGKPTKPILKSVLGIADGKGIELSWKIDSYSPITEYELLYKLQDGGEWKPVAPVVESGTLQGGNVYIARHVLNGLQPLTYQAKLRAKNSFGWSDTSDPHTFSGHNLPLEEEPSAQGPLEAVAEDGKRNTASELRISFALLLSLVVSRYYC